jgi:hypothetical protein
VLQKKVYNLTKRHREKGLKEKAIMYKYQDRDTHQDNWFKGFLGGSFYETETDEYGITDGFTFTFLGNNFNFAKEIK